MKWNAFELLEPAMQKTKKLLFPIKLKYWFKLGLVSMLSASEGAGGSFRIPNFSGSGSSPGANSKIGSVTGNAVANLKDPGYFWPLFVVVAFIGIVFGLIWGFITSVFSFIFIDALVVKDYSIKKSWSKSKGGGLSFFGFRILIGLISLAIVGLLFLPIIISLVRYGFAYFEIFSVWQIILTFAFSIISVLIYIFLLVIFLSFVKNFALPEMYKKQTGMTRAIKNMFKNIWRQKLEAFVYFLALVLFNIVVGVAAVIAFILFVIVLIPFWVMIFVIGLGVFYLSFITGIIFSVVVGVPLFIFMVYLFNVIILPLTCFMRYFSLLSYEKLFNTKLFKKH